MNYLGEPSNEGRLEIRYKGEWGTLSFDDSNKDFIKLVCKNLNFASNNYFIILFIINYINFRWEIIK